MKTNYLILVFIALIINNSFAQQYDWGHSIGSNVGGSEDYVFSTIDNAGNVVLVGNYAYAMDLDFGPDSAMVTSNNGGIYIAKYASDGTYIWHKEIQSPGSVTGLYANAVTTDINNNILLTGSFQGTVDFDPSAGVVSHSSGGWTSIYTLKFNAAGRFGWVRVTKNYPGSGGHSNSYGIATDDIGDVYTVGYIKGTADFNPGGTAISKTSNGGEDAFAVKYSQYGVTQWVDVWGGTSDDACQSVGFHTVSGLYVTGYFSDTVDMIPGTSVALYNSNGLKDGFLSRILHNTGDVQLVRQIGGPANDIIYDFDFDLSGNLLLTGVFSGTADLSPSGSVANFTSNGALDAFVIKVNSAGYVFWIKRFGGNGDDYARTISVDGDLSIAIGGYFKYQGDFETDEMLSYPLSTTSEFDAYLLMLQDNGDFSWVHRFGGSGFQFGTSVVNQGNNEVLFSGYFNQGTDLNPGTGVASVTALSWDGFLIKLNNCPTLNGSSIVEACVSYTSSQGAVWTSSGNYTEIYLSSLGCDSTHTTNLTINSPYAFVDTALACDTYFWTVNSTSYTSSGVYTANFTSVHGCDSLHTLDLTINESYLIEDVVTACVTYIWPLNNTTFTSSGIFDDVFTSQGGCDSTHRLKLTINEPPYIGISLENSVLSADSSGYAYQWINCSDNSAIVGATNQSFTPSDNGVYAVVLTNGACLDTSQCVAVSAVGIQNINQVLGLKIYPNPSKDIFMLELVSEEGFSLEIRDTKASLIYAKSNLEQQEIIDLSHVNTGVYFLKLRDNSGQLFTSKLIKL